MAQVVEIEVKSHSVACFLIGLGYEPIRACIARNGEPQYVFHADHVRIGMPRYGAARATLAVLVAEARR